MYIFDMYTHTGVYITDVSLKIIYLIFYYIYN